MLYKLNRLSLLHKIIRAISYFLLRVIPSKYLWLIFHSYLKNKAPYKYLSDGDVVIQIGFPSDILKTGRSRAVHFAMKVGARGRVLVVEPDLDNVILAKEFIKKNNLKNIIIEPIGAWSHRTTLSFLIDRNNPASNLIKETWDESRSDSNRFDEVTINVDSLDEIALRNDIENPKLLSITANGSENEILKGAPGLLRKVQFISLIGDVSNIHELKSLKIESVVDDDRGATFLLKS